MFIPLGRHPQNVAVIMACVFTVGKIETKGVISRFSTLFVWGKIREVSLGPIFSNNKGILWANELLTQFYKLLQFTSVCV